MLTIELRYGSTENLGLCASEGYRDRSAYCLILGYSEEKVYCC